MKRLLMFLTICIAIIYVPYGVNALSKTEVESELQKLYVDNEDGSCTWSFNSVDVEEIYNNYCVYTKEAYLEAFPYASSLSDAELTLQIQEHEAYCRDNYLDTIINSVAAIKGVPRTLYIDAADSLVDGKLYAELPIENENGTGKVTKSCSYSQVDVDTKTIEKVDNILSQVKGSYTLYGLNTFNSVYHYGGIDNELFDSKIVLMRHPGFKKVIMNNAEFEYEISWNGAGGTPTGTGTDGNLIVYKNGTIYGLKRVGFGLEHVFYVDKDVEGTPVEKAQARLENYFKNKVDVEVDASNAQVWTKENDGADGVYTTVRLGNYSNAILIVEVSRDELDKYEVEAYHKKTNVKVHSDSYEVPTDATIDVEDVKADAEKAFDKDTFKVVGAYDIDVIKTGNGGFVKTIENGIDVYLPTANRQVGEKLFVYHVDNNKKGDKYNGEVVEVDGQQYVKFRTTHFSTYAVVEDAIENPNTNDTIGIALVFMVISFIGMTSLYIRIKKFN